MQKDLPITASEKAIFDDTFTALSELDERFRLDSELYLAQTGLHEGRIAESNAELERLRANAETRHKELSTRRKKLAAGALELYVKCPEIADGRARVFALADQLVNGRRADAPERQASLKGLLALDDAVANNQPIVRVVNGNFSSFIIPDTDTFGLSPIIEHRQHIDEMSADVYLPIKQGYYFFGNSQFPESKNNTRHELLDEFSPNDRNERGYRGYGYAASAAVASSYDLRDGLQKHPENLEDSKEVIYIIGEDLIGESIKNSSSRRGHSAEKNTEFAFKAWLTGKLAGYDLACEPKKFESHIIDRASDIIVSCTESYPRSDVAPIDSKTSRILLTTLRDIGAEGKLFERFSSRLAQQSNSRAIYRDQSVVRTMFDAIIGMSDKSGE